MPEFICGHTPDNLTPFVRGYLECVEWLLPEEIDHDKIRGFSRAAIRQAKLDCKDFAKANAADLAEYETISGRDMAHAGHDFYLSRNGHGAGFFDRGHEAVFRRLQAAAKVYGETYHDLSRGWIV